MGKVIAALALAAILAGCTTTGTDGCTVFAPIIPTPADVDVISDPLVNQVLSHNETGKRICGWK